MSNYQCAVCGLPIEGDDPHTVDETGEDCHAGCCPTCRSLFSDLVDVFLGATDDLPDDAEAGVLAVLQRLDEEGFFGEYARGLLGLRHEIQS